MAQVMKRLVFLPPVPAFILKSILGEMSDVILKGSRVSSEKIIKSGYQFAFDNLYDALADIITIQSEVRSQKSEVRSLLF